MDLQIKYKEHEFTVKCEEGSEENVFIIINIEEFTSDVIERFNDETFFNEYVGMEYNNSDSDKIIRRIKKSLAKFIIEDTGETDTQEEEVVVEVVQKNGKSKPKPEGAIDRIIFETVERALSSEESRTEIDTLIKDLIKENGVVPFRKILEVKKGNAKPKDVGLQHYEFERIFKTVAAGVPIALVGPAGSGKTTIVYNVAKALEMEFASQSVSAQSTTFDFFGYKNAKGEYVSTLFREKYEKGGVYLLDEFDAGNPNVLAALNQATANDIAPFPDKMVEKHKDFIIVMAGNTYGLGGTIDYVGRNKIDAATLDRFVFIHVDYDEELEEQLAINKDWCKRVQRFRRIAKDKKVRVIISPRATFNGEKLLNVGIPQKKVEDMVIFKGLTQDERNLINI